MNSTYIIRKASFREKVTNSYLVVIGNHYLSYCSNQQTELCLPEFYIYNQNPVSFHWNYIGIETGYKKGDPNSIHQIWITPLYFVLLAVFILVISAFLKKK